MNRRDDCCHVLDESGTVLPERHFFVSARHIAVLISALGAGGAERVIALLAAHWVDRGRRVSIITFDRPEDPIYHALPPGIELHRLDCTGKGTSANLRRIARLRSTLKVLQPEVFLSFLTKNNLLAALAGFGLPHGWIACERNNPEMQKANPLWNRMLRLAYHRSDAIVCQTQGVKRSFPIRLRDRLVVIPNPVALPAFEAGRGSCRAVAVGRLDQQKGFDILIDAFSNIIRRHPGWMLDIWGDGQERSRLQAQIDSRGMGDVITLRGTSEQPGSWIAQADIFILSSRYEGFPNVLGEAMAAGLPVVATRCDFGPEEMLTEPTSGLLVPPGEVGQLAGAINRLISDADMRERLSNQARTAAARYSPEAILPDWDQLVDRLARQRLGLTEKLPQQEGRVAGL